MKYDKQNWNDEEFEDEVRKRNRNKDNRKDKRLQIKVIVCVHHVSLPSL